MRWTDILEQSLHNLFRRRLRTLLTMLGVVIGTAAIIVTLSLGAGAEKAQMDALESTTNLKLIEVSPYYGSSLAGDQGKRITRITDSVISDIRAMQGVDAVTPMVTVMLGAQAVVKTGDYENSTTILAVLPADFAKIQPLKSGEYFTGRTDRMEFIMSEVALLDFVRTRITSGSTPIPSCNRAASCLCRPFPGIPAAIPWRCAGRTGTIICRTTTSRRSAKWRSRRS